MKNITKFTNTVQLSPGKTYFQSLSTGVCGYINSPSWVDRPIGIYDDLTSFLQLIDMVESPEITIKDQYIEINGVETNIKYRYCDPSLCGESQTVANIIETTPDDFELIHEGTLSKQLLQFLKNSTALSDADIITYNQNIVVQSSEIDKLLLSKPNIFFNDLGEFVSSYEFVKLPLKDYNFKTYYNKTRNRIRLSLYDDDIFVMVSLVGR